MGTGTYLLHPEVFGRLGRRLLRPTPSAGRATGRRGSPTLARGGARDRARFTCTGQYVNINSRDDLNYANYLVRDAASTTPHQPRLRHRRARREAAVRADRSLRRSRPRSTRSSSSRAVAARRSRPVASGPKCAW